MVMTAQCCRCKERRALVARGAIRVSSDPVAISSPKTNIKQTKKTHGKNILKTFWKTPPFFSTKLHRLLWLQTARPKSCQRHDLPSCVSACVKPPRVPRRPRPKGALGALEIRVFPEKIHHPMESRWCPDF